ncbi:MAG: BrnT family toxin [Thermodesulfobacteriota bacterium]
MFTWNEDKAANNFTKHGITLEEAATVFNDPYFIDFYDPDHSEDEDRFIIIGMSNLQRLLIVSYTERQSSIRLISARETTRQERKTYEEY